MTETIPVPRVVIGATCGHCHSGDHARCPVICANGTRTNIDPRPGKVSWVRQHARCGCDVEGCRDKVRCVNCGNRTAGEVDSERMECVDTQACHAEQMARADQMPTALQQALREVIADVRERERQREESDPEKIARKRERLAQLGQKRPSSGNCLCCGEPTKGGLFLPGHDARLVSRLVAGVKTGAITRAQAESQLAQCKPALREKLARKLVR